MEWTLVVGYLAAIIGAFYVLPQTVHVIRVGSSAGLSPLTWQLQVGASTGWTVHGFLTGQPNVWACNIVVLCCAAIILIVICRDRKLSWNVWVLSVLVAGALVTVDSVFGAVAYGMLIIVPMTVSMMIQFQALWVVPDFRGYSWFYNAFAGFTQILWLIYAFGNHEQAIQIGASATFILQMLCLGLYMVKRAGVQLPGLPATSPPCPPAERQMGHGLAPWGPL
ncbi:Hypothetical protein PFCIRM513_12540 [Propionibacterium freudenreichii]|uniref:SemiSWEET family sugar transporter n=1 Tax=Propionibacterium freudenreichii TaxID=1744 RepID=UPI0005A5CD01|nr:hypothetical protein [Propionibacterium freudenreichii]MDK9676057.1 hypothetical protein [Propionibacterium freudenreichii]CEI47880.1 Hypothetical protein PFCIRM513_12540 [Propionibacterium freudenreichii]SCQ46386.1 Hypothetical protein PFR_JS7-1_1436 [Propionibacterium freudenreichii]SCQ52482.1 Hypothetical protein PFR_JS7-2_1436 [Propionibacterium freudenreichii]